MKEKEAELVQLVRQLSDKDVNKKILSIRLKIANKENKAYGE